MRSRTLGQIKAEENFQAFAGFKIHGKRKFKDGVLKISAHTREDGSGYLVFTFLVDVGGKRALAEALERLFSRLTDKALSPLLGGDYQYRDLYLGAEGGHEGWSMTDVYFHFTDLARRIRRCVEQVVIPALEELLPLDFEVVQWWDEPSGPGAEGTGDSGEDESGFKGFLAFLRDRTGL